MTKKRHLLLTFDYELFLGERSGDVDSCMIDPTKRLQSIFDEFGVTQAIFFVDTTYLACLKRNLDDDQCKKDYENVKENISFLLEKGHYVFPHIHPHWLDAKRNNRDWVLTNLNKYCFKNCSEAERAQIWKDSIDILTEFGVQNYHPVDGFRAGGWSIQPFSDFQPFFEQYGIEYDFTVMPGTYSWTNAQQYDYTASPQKEVYRFDSDVNLESQEGRFVELQIGTRPKSERKLSEKILMKYLWKTGNRSIGKGQGVMPSKESYQQEKAPLSVEMISIELLHMLNLKEYKNYLNDHSVMHFISHPKMLSPHNLKYFRKFIKYARQNFNLDFDFKSIEV